MSSGTALLLIDPQWGLIAGPLPAWDGSGVLARMGALLARARAAGAPVVYVQHDADDGLLAVDSPGWEIHPELMPLPGELVLHARTANAFYETLLQSELNDRGVRRLVVAGCSTETCVDTTCRRATELGFDVVLASDGHTTLDSPVLAAEQMVAYHNWLLDGSGTTRHRIGLTSCEQIQF